LLLRDIGDLLVQAEGNSLSPENLADSGRLTSLLGKLGLEKPEIEALLRQSQEQGPGVNAKALFNLLEQAAQKQNQHITQMLREIIARGTPDRQAETSPGMILHAQMIKSQQHMEKQVEQMSADTPSTASTAPETSAGLENMKTETGAAVLAGKTAPRPENSENSESGLGHQRKERGDSKQESAEARVLSPTGTAENLAKGGLLGGRTSLLPAYVVRQVAWGFERMTARSLDHLSLSLKPPSLGEISMDLAVKDGAVKASLVAETVAAKRALEAGLDSLKQHLANQGIKVQQIEISVQPDAQRRQERAQDGEKQNRGKRRETAEAPGETDSPAALNGRFSVRA
jgi:flagellar hook-length control protein FliK